MTEYTQTQMAFVKIPIVQPQHYSFLSVPERALLFHLLNRQVYAFLEREALDHYKLRIGPLNIQYFFVRYRVLGARTVGESYKISNSFSPYYARYLCMNNMQLWYRKEAVGGLEANLHGLFDLKPLHGKNKNGWETTKNILKKNWNISYGEAERLLLSEERWHHR